ncbi:Uncharacterized protein APZ42_016527 [Daphnia magna]|uniref:Uncharacterized protein n=1 Tax=Daphnia magna TaxID=35525 RepID=A0A165AGH6_9CRUS|nr:Uncharacterized protein APZ42_016527 [Daphnia magna]
MRCSLWSSFGYSCPPFIVIWLLTNLRFHFRILGSRKYHVHLEIPTCVISLQLCISLSCS